MRKGAILFIACLFVSGLGLYGQSFVFPGDFFFDSEHHRNILSDSNTVAYHTSLLPYNNATKIYGQRHDDLFIKDGKWFGRKLFNEDLVELNHTDYQSGWARKFLLNISPLFNFQAGIDKADTSGEKLYINSRGLLLKGNINDKVMFESVFLENQAVLPQYQDDFATATLVIPGSGRWKKFKTNGYDYAMASGYILYKPCRFFSLQLGHGKHKIGNGYRSLLLSDNSFTYPYARFTNTWWKGKIQYTNIYAVLMNLTGGDVPVPPGTERVFQKKAAAFHHLSFNFNKYFSVSLFQSLIWNTADSTNRMNIELPYFNPVIFSNAALYGMADNRNIMTGIDISIRPFKSLMIYGQLVADELAGGTAIGNKTGWQAGIKYFDAFTLKNLYLQVEYNTVRPFTYSATDNGQAYTHYNQALAHPSGANFKEAVGIMAYRYKRFFINGKMNLISQGLNLGNNYGQDVFTSDFNPALNAQSQNQGIASGTTLLDGCIGFLFNSKTNMNICAGMLMRTQKIESAPDPRDTKYFYIAFRTSLYNTYWDF